MRKKEPPFGKVKVIENADGKQTFEVSQETARTVGLGDLVKAITDKLGIKQCDGCKERQVALNKINLDALAGLARSRKREPGASS